MEKKTLGIIAAFVIIGIILIIMTNGKSPESFGSVHLVDNTRQNSVYNAQDIYLSRNNPLIEQKSESENITRGTGFVPNLYSEVYKSAPAEFRTVR